MTKFKEIFAALAEPFAPSEVKVRSENGRQMQYVTERTICNRLDNVLGPENWWPKRVVVGEAVVQCELTIRLPDGSTVTKDNVGTGKADNPKSNPWKTAYSDSLKRAAVEFGIARYLYRDGVPFYAMPPSPGEVPNDPPARPAPQQHAPANGNGHHGGGSVPRSGRALFAWVKEQETKGANGLLKHVNGFIKANDLPARIVDLDADQTRLVYDEAVRKLNSASPAWGGGREPGCDDDRED